MRRSSKDHWSPREKSRDLRVLSLYSIPSSLPCENSRVIRKLRRPRSNPVPYIPYTRTTHPQPLKRVSSFCSSSPVCRRPPPPPTRTSIGTTITIFTMCRKLIQLISQCDPLSKPHIKLRDGRGYPPLTRLLTSTGDIKETRDEI